MTKSKQTVFYTLYWLQFMEGKPLRQCRRCEPARKSSELAEGHGKTKFSDEDEITNLCDKLNEAWAGQFYHRPQKHVRKVKAKE